MCFFTSTCDLCFTVYWRLCSINKLIQQYKKNLEITQHWTLFCVIYKKKKNTISHWFIVFGIHIDINIPCISKSNTNKKNPHSKHTLTYHYLAGKSSRFWCCVSANPHNDAWELLLLLHKWRHWGLAKFTWASDWTPPICYRWSGVWSLHYRTTKTIISTIS